MLVRRYLQGTVTCLLGSILLVGCTVIPASSTPPLSSPPPLSNPPTWSVESSQTLPTLISLIQNPDSSGDCQVWGISRLPATAPTAWRDTIQCRTGGVAREPSSGAIVATLTTQQADAFWAMLDDIGFGSWPDWWISTTFDTTPRTYKVVYPAQSSCCMYMQYVFVTSTLQPDGWQSFVDALQGMVGIPTTSPSPAASADS